MVCAQTSVAHEGFLINLDLHGRDLVDAAADLGQRRGAHCKLDVLILEQAVVLGLEVGDAAVDAVALHEHVDQGEKKNGENRIDDFHGVAPVWFQWMNFKIRYAMAIVMTTSASTVRTSKQPISPRNAVLFSF